MTFTVAVGLMWLCAAIFGIGLVAAIYYRDPLVFMGAAVATTPISVVVALMALAGFLRE